MRIAIIGGPKTGKTTLSVELAKLYPSIPVYHTDDLIATHDWSEASRASSTWLDHSDYLIEGVTVIRALRKWHAAHPGHPASPPPLDRLIYLTQPKAPAGCQMVLSRGQESMGKGVRTIFEELAGWLGKLVEYPDG